MKKIKEKRERALGTKLFLKPERCSSHKCVMVRRPYRPGAHGKKRHTVSEYGKQLQEKQKVQAIYGLTNRQLRNVFRGEKSKAMRVLEHRLDRVVFLLGFAGAPRVARQLVSHGHILVNGRKVTIPSYSVRVGDTISIKPSSKKLKLFEGLEEQLKKHEVPEWLSLNPEELSGSCIGRYSYDPEKLPFDDNLVLQFYAR